MVLFAYPFFALLETKDTGLIILAMSLACGIGLGSTFGPQGAFLVELFETRFRLTGIAVARGFNGVAVSGLTPLIASALILFAGGGAGYVIAYLAFWQVVSIVGAVFAKGARCPDQAKRFLHAEQGRTVESFV